MDIKKVKTKPFADQRPGTSGVRKKTRVFMEPHYLENFVQSTFDALKGEGETGFSNKTLVIGGDGRFYNRSAIQTMIRMAVANGFSHVMVGRGGVVSTPAVSAVIRAQRAFGGFILSASHNPGGIDEDFGVKYNISNGGPAPANVTERIFERSKQIDQYFIADVGDIDIDRFGSHKVNGATISVFDPLADYTALMEKLFDFEVLSNLLKGGGRMCFDAMHASTGPYAHHIFENCLGAPEGTVINGTPLEDFAGGHPDPNQAHAKELINRMAAKNAPDLGGASDGDGDRNLILGPDFFVTPGDSLAIIVEYAGKCIPGYRDGLQGVARSMPTSRAVDKVAAELGIPCYETPTGWKFFGSLMDAGKCTICGEESFGTGSNHVREKDGLWAVLCWLSILAHTKLSVPEVAHAHWQRFGRSYFQRHDHEGLNASVAEEMMSELREGLPQLVGTSLGGHEVIRADDFCYTDPVDGSVSSRQGIRVFLEDGSRVVCRLSGTGTEGATLRVYLESYRTDGGKGDINQLLAPLASAMRELLRLRDRFGSDQPTVVT